LAQACRAVCTFVAASVVAMTVVAMELLQEQMLMVLSALVNNQRVVAQLRAQVQSQEDEITVLKAQIADVAREQVIHNGLIEQLWERLRSVQGWLNSVWSWIRLLVKTN